MDEMTGQIIISVGGPNCDSASNSDEEESEFFKKAVTVVFQEWNKWCNVSVYDE